MARAPVALVVLTHQRRREVCDTVERALALPERPRIVVVDNGSSDGTSEALRRFEPQIRLVTLPRNLGAAGRNAGVHAAERPYVAFSDDDCWWSPGALGRAVARLESDPGLAVVSARVRVEPDGRDDPACLAMARSPLHAGGGPSLVGFLAGACVMRRGAFLEAGGYEPRLFLGGEEALLALDLLARGWRLGYAPEVVAHHRPSRSRDAALRRHLLRRNAVYVAWLRRPPSRALAIAARRLVEAAREGGGTKLVRELAVAAPWLRAERRPVPPDVEARVRAVERWERAQGAEPPPARRAWRRST